MGRHKAAQVGLGLVGGLLLQGEPPVGADGHRQAGRQHGWPWTVLSLRPGPGYAQGRAELGRPRQLL